MPGEEDCTFPELYSLEMLLPGKPMPCLCLQKGGQGPYGNTELPLHCPVRPRRRKSLPRAQERPSPACAPGKWVSPR